MIGEMTRLLHARSPSADSGASWLSGWLRRSRELKGLREWMEHKPNDEAPRLLFTSGIWYRHGPGVSPEAVEQLVDAASVGREVNESIRNEYPYVREG